MEDGPALFERPATNGGDPEETQPSLALAAGSHLGSEPLVGRSPSCNTIKKMNLFRKEKTPAFKIKKKEFLDHPTSHFKHGKLKNLPMAVNHEQKHTFYSFD